jgi:hypothetical protein
MSVDVPEHRALTVSHPLPRRYVALGLIVVVIILLGALIVIRDAKTQTNTAAVETFNPAPPTLLFPLTHLPAAVTNVAVVPATDPITPLKPTGNHVVWEAATRHVGPRPVVFFYGAEFAPYAAAERWPVIVALARFGSFGTVGLMQSSNSVAFGDTPTFTFSHATYSSDRVDLQMVERYSALNPTGARYMKLQTPTATQSAAVAVYDPGGSTFPLLDIANRYVLVGSSFSPSVLAGVDQSQIVADLAIPTSPITQAIVVSANEITAAICTVTGQRPSAVCQARGVTAADAKLKTPSAP